CYREAIRCQPGDAEAHYSLGNALRDRGKVGEAITSFREAVRLKPGFAFAHCNLGLALTRQGRFAEGLRHLYRRHELGSCGPDRSSPSRLWVRQCRRLLELDANLPAVLAGKQHPASPREAIEYAQLCLTYKRRYADSVRLDAEAFDADRKLAEDLRAG